MNLILIAAAFLSFQGAKAPKPPLPPPAFTSNVPVAQLQGKQAVIETTAGRIVMDLLPDAAPNHVAYFVKLANDGAYTGTTFHRAVKFGIIQGGDPLSKDPGRRDAYGTGGLGVLKAEPGAGKHTKGAVSSVILPGRPDSGGAQFFICIVDQPTLDGQYTVFARVVEGMAVASRISEAAVDEKGKIVERIEIKSVTVRDRPAPQPAAFSTDTPEQLAAYNVVLETTAGTITLGFRPDKAPEHVRNFLRLAAAGVYDGTAFHRVVRGFVIQGGFDELPAEAARRAAAGARANAAARVQRHHARPRDAVDGARGRSRERDDVVLHLHGACDRPRRQVHGVRAGARRTAGRASHRGCRG